jgi:hypothetical protein
MQKQPFRAKVVAFQQLIRVSQLGVANNQFESKKIENKVKPKMY